VVEGGDRAAKPLSSYEIRLEYVCMSLAGCGRTVQLHWAAYPAASTLHTPPERPHGVETPPPSPPPLPVPPPPPFKPIPASVMIPTQGANEIKRRALQAKLQSGWGTFYHPSNLAWALLPESFVVKAGLYRFSTGDFLPPDG
jgi:hypothetical protein